MDNNKLTPNGEPSLGSFRKKWDNYWYHYKFQTIIALIAAITLIICSVQFLTREKHDYRLLYAGPQIVALQDIVYMEKAVSELADDFDGNGEVIVAFDDIVMLSPEERVAAQEAGAVLNGEFINTSMTEYYQQIVGGDAVICFLSPYMYELVHQSDGFLPLTEILKEIPDSAYDDCAIVLAKTDFGQYFNGMNDLPENTVVCVRRLSTMAKLKGEDKTKKSHEANVELFKKIVSFEAPEGFDSDNNAAVGESQAVNVEFGASFIRADGYGNADLLKPFADNADAVAGEPSKQLLVSCIRGTNKLTRLLTDAGKGYQFDISYDGAASLKEAAEKYDEDYFAENLLLLIHIEEPSGSIRHKINKIERNGNKLAVSLERIVPEVGTDDMADWFALIELKLSDAEGVISWEAMCE